MPCLIDLVLLALLLTICVVVFEVVVEPQPKITKLVRLLVGVFVLLRALECLAVLPAGTTHFWRCP